MRDIDYGTVRIKLNELIEQQGISKNRLAHRAEMQPVYKFLQIKERRLMYTDMNEKLRDRI